MSGASSRLASVHPGDPRRAVMTPVFRPCQCMRPIWRAGSHLTRGATTPFQPPPCVLHLVAPLYHHLQTAGLGDLGPLPGDDAKLQPEGLRADLDRLTSNLR